MKLFKVSTFIFLAVLLSICNASAQEVDLDTVGQANVPSPRAIAQAQRATNNEVDYMVEHYSLPELARYAIQINKLQIKEAQKSGTTPPAKLTKEILSDKQKIGEYLRSFYKYTY